MDVALTVNSLSGSSEKLDPILSIANWNLERINPNQKRYLSMKEHFASVAADIWFLTETHVEATPNVGFFSCFSADPDRVSKAGEKWSSIWSRWPIEILTDYVGDPSRCVAGRISESPFGEIITYATVLPWLSDPRGKIIGAYQAYAEALRMQSVDWQKIQQDFVDATLIVAGDFNQDLSERHYYGSTKQRTLLTKSLREGNLCSLTSGGNDPIARDSSPMACIDHICVSKSARWVLESATRWPDSPKPVVSLSDHFGVSVQLRRPSQV